MAARPLSLKNFIDVVESQLIDCFPGKLSDMEVLASRTHHLPYPIASIRQYLLGRIHQGNPIISSTTHTQGMLYNDGHLIFGVAVTYNWNDYTKPYIHIVTADYVTLEKLSLLIHKIDKKIENAIVVKHSLAKRELYCAVEPTNK